MTYGLLFMAFSMGLLGSPHCLGMCGGLVTAFGLSMQSVSPSKKRRLIATYHLGRLTSYALLGILASLIGVTVLQPFMQGNATPRILLGLVLVFIGVSMLGLPLLNKLEVIGMRFWQKLSPLRQKVFPLTTYPKAMAAGLLWGFLPCGLVYGALMIAVVGHNVTTGALLMLVFGLGTVPMLVATHSTVNWMRTHIDGFKLRQLNGSLMVLSGLAVIVLPIVMANMHGDHGNHNGHSSHMNQANQGDEMVYDMSDMDIDMSSMDMSEHNHVKMDDSTPAMMPTQMSHSTSHDMADHAQMPTTNQDDMAHKHH